MANFLADTFAGTGAIHGRTPDIGFSGLTWVSEDYPATRASGFVVSSDTTNTNSYGEVGYGAFGADYDQPGEFDINFVFKTGPSVAPNGDGHAGVDFTIWIGGSVFGMSLRADPGGDWTASLGGDSEVVTLAPNTEYTGTAHFSDGAQTFSIAGADLSRSVSYANGNGLQWLRFLVGHTCGFKNLTVGGNIVIVEDVSVQGEARTRTTLGFTESLTVTGEAITTALSDRATTDVKVRAEGRTATYTHTDAISNVTNQAHAFGRAVPLIQDDVSVRGEARTSLSVGVVESVRDTVLARTATTTSRGFASDVSSMVLARTALATSAAGDDISVRVEARTALVASRVTREDVSVAAAALTTTTERAAVREDVMVQGEMHAALSSQLQATSDVQATAWALTALWIDAYLQAWVMNAKTSAMWRYTALPYESVAVVGGRVLALGSSGFFELDGADDDGQKIHGHLVTGFDKLGSDMVKSLGDVTMKYVSKEGIALSVTQYPAGPKSTYTYAAPKRAADAPRGHRVTPGKGFSSMYYQFKIANTKGAQLTFLEAAVDTFPSKTRRVQS